MSETATEVTKICEAVDAVIGVVPRALADMPDLVHHKGAKEVATLTVAVREQAFTFKPVMEALQVLASGDIDWSKSFLVAHDLKSSKSGPSFDWKKSPDRSYASFDDFYHRELETTWGKWEKLQHTWSEVVKGKITEAEGRRIVLRKQGRPWKSNKGGHDDCDSTFVMNPDEKNTKAHWLARLDQKHHELAAKVRAGELSANAAAIEAGFRKKRPSKRKSALDKILKLLVKLLPQLSDDDCHALIAHIETRMRGQLL